MTDARIKIAVMTSGGDAQGMNASVRAVVRGGIVKGCQVWLIMNGYQGLLDEDLRETRWDDVSGYLSLGGTALGTARCMTYQNDVMARRQAVYALVSRGIDRLVCIGGDGSLTGADVMRREWAEHISALVQAGKLTAAHATRHQRLRIAGLVGSIDNDMVGSDSTIGADSALHRIVEALDAIMTTASSHQRSFVVEVMGRHCGYLALMAALATGADWVFIPERPMEASTWRQRLATSITKRRALGTRHSTVIVAEGALDSEGNKITATEVKDTIEKLAGLETRVTVLGHIQRGGVPSAYDRSMATLVGLESVEALLDEAAADTVLIGTKGDLIVRSPLMESVAATKEVGKALAAKDWDKAFTLRGPQFQHAWSTYKVVARAFPHEHPEEMSQKWGVMHVGAPAPGMNAAVRAVVRLGLDRGHKVYGIYNGFAGLAEMESGKMSWQSVAGWSNLGGALLGSNRDQPEEVPGGIAAVASALGRLQLDALVIIGGWEAYTAAATLSKPELRKEYPALNLAMVLVPATISNNCPGSHHSIGADTAVNTIVDTSDRLKQSAMASRRRVFICETMGGHCGYLTLAGAIAGGAQMAYLPEHPLRLGDIVNDINLLKERFTHCRSTTLILNNECSSKTYTTQLITDLMNEESDDLFNVRLLILGHVQQGHQPSPKDRVLATDLALEAANLLHETLARGGRTWVGAVGLVDDEFVHTPLDSLIASMDLVHRRPKDQWWTRLESTLRKIHGGTKDSAKHYSRPLESALFKDTEQVIPNLATMSQVQLVQASRSATNLIKAHVRLSLLARDKDEGSPRSSGAAARTTPKDGNQ